MTKLQILSVLWLLALLIFGLFTAPLPTLIILGTILTVAAIVVLFTSWLDWSVRRP